jgi:hypothetical protein
MASIMGTESLLTSLALLVALTHPNSARGGLPERSEPWEHLAADAKPAFSSVAFLPSPCGLRCCQFCRFRLPFPG